MKIHEYTLKAGITRTREFERKGLATHAVNVGTRCSHGCLYCSSGALLRMHKSFSELGLSPFETGYAIVDPDTPQRVDRDARRIRDRGMIQLGTTVDAWAPEAKKHDLGRRCLQAILDQPGWTVRTLTKNAAVTRDFDIIEQYRDRVLVGLSITSTPDKRGVMSIIEPSASPITERMAALREAHARGLRTYAMFCPLLPGIADAPEQIDGLVRLGSRSTDLCTCGTTKGSTRGDSWAWHYLQKCSQKCSTTIRVADDGRMTDRKFLPHREICNGRCRT